MSREGREREGEQRSGPPRAAKWFLTSFLFRHDGPLRSTTGVAREFSDALNRDVTYSDIPPEDWDRQLKNQQVPEHLALHLLTMAELHRAGRYDRMADGVQLVTGRPAMSIREFVSLHADKFGGRRS